MGEVMNKQIQELAADARGQMVVLTTVDDEQQWRQHEEFVEKFAALVEAAARADERELIKKAVEELNPVENNPLLQNKPASFWIQNFKQIVSERGTT